MKKNDKVQHLRNEPTLRFPTFNKNWTQKIIGDILTIKSGKDQKSVESPNGVYPIYGTGGIIGYGDDYLTDKNCVCIGRKGTINKPIYMTSPFWSVDTLFYSEIKEGNDPKFQYNLFETINWYKYNEASGVPSLSRRSIESIKVYIPDFTEQKEIGLSLGSVEKKIRLLEDKLENLKLFKRGYISKYVNGEITLKLGDLIEEISNEKLDNDYVVLTSSKNGIFTQSEYFKQDVASNDTLKYKLLKKGDYTYRSMSDTGDFTFNRLKHLEEGIISPAYPTFTSKNCDNRYVEYLLNSYQTKREIFKIKQGGTRFALKFNTLKKISINILQNEMQQEFCDNIETIDIKVKKTTDNLIFLKKFKKGLLQQMFV